MTGETSPTQPDLAQSPQELNAQALPPEEPQAPPAPPEPPAPPPAPAPRVFQPLPCEFYGLNLSKGALKEFTWSNTPLLLPITLPLGLFVKATGYRVNAHTEDPAIHQWAPFEVQDIPDDTRSRFIPLGTDLAGLGFSAPIYHIVEDPLRDIVYSTATLLHTSGKAIARVYDRQWFLQAAPKPYLQVQFLTRFTDNTWLLTNNAMPDALAPASVHVQHKVGAGAKALWDLHLQRIADIGKPIQPIESASDIRTAIDALHAQLRDFHLARGVFYSLDAHEQEHLRLASVSHQALAQEPFYTRCIYAQANRNTIIKKQSWLHAILMLVITGVAFVLTFLYITPSWGFIAMIVGVLLIHETGHFIAMKSFGYKNVKMFFIPFFGAAVSGRPERVASWKQVVTYLAGPIPGILLAVPLVILGIAMQNKTVLEFAGLLLFLNAFNLIPIIPFDGGHIVHKSLFIRHPVIEAVFRIIAAGCLVLLGLGFMILGGGKSPGLTVGIAVWMAISLPLAIKTAWFVHNTRETIPLEEPDVPLPIGPAAGQAIINHLTAASSLQKGIQNKKQIAALTTPIVDSLRSQPPHIVASLGFVALQFGAMFFAFIMCIFVALVIRGKMPAPFNLHANQVQQFDEHPLAQILPVNVVENPLQVETDSGYAPATGQHRIILVNFTDEPAAKAGYQGLSSIMPEKSGRLLCSSLVILNVSDIGQPAIDSLSTQLKAKAQKVQILEGESSINYNLKIQAPSPAAATAIADEINKFQELGTQTNKLIPPWQLNDPRTAEQKAQHNLARETLRQINDVYAARLKTDKELNELNAKIRKQVFTSDQDGDFKAISDRSDQIRTDCANLVKTLPNTDTALPDLYIADWTQRNAPHPSSSTQPIQYMTRTIKRMGSIEDLSASTPQSACTYVNARVVNDAIGINISFTDPIQGPRALITWIESKGCTLLSIGVEEEYSDYD